MDDNTSLADDLVRGAAELAIEICGRDTPKNRRRVYYVASLPDNPFGLFKIGDALCGRKQRLRSIGLSTCVAIAVIILYNFMFDMPAHAATLASRLYQDPAGSGLGLLATLVVAAVSRAKHASQVLPRRGRQPRPTGWTRSACTPPPTSPHDERRPA